MAHTNWDELPIILSVKETAVILGYGEASIRDLCRTHDGIPCLRYGRAYRIPKETLHQWLLQQSLNRSTEPTILN